MKYKSLRLTTAPLIWIFPRDIVRPHWTSATFLLSKESCDVVDMLGSAFNAGMQQAHSQGNHHHNHHIGEDPQCCLSLYTQEFSFPIWFRRFSPWALQRAKYFPYYTNYMSFFLIHSVREFDGNIRCRAACCFKFLVWQCLLLITHEMWNFLTQGRYIVVPPPSLRFSVHAVGDSFGLILSRFSIFILR